MNDISKDELMRSYGIEYKTGVFSNLNGTYRELLGIITESAEKHSFFLNKAILTISSGAIGLFFSFVDVIFLQNSLAFLQIYIKIATVSFTTAIAFVLLSFAVSQIVFKVQIDKLNDWYNKRSKALDELFGYKSFDQQERLLQKIQENPNLSSFWNTLMHIFSFVAGLLFFIGILSSILTILFLGC